MMPLRILLGLSLLAAVALAPAQISKRGSGHLFRIAWKKGQTATYDVTSIAGSLSVSRPAKRTGQATINVKSVSNGIAKVEVTHKGTATSGYPVETLSIDRRGRIQSGDSSPNIIAPALPAGAITPGDSWSDKRKLNSPLTGELTITSTFTLKRFYNSRGKRLAELTEKSTSTGPTMSGTGSGVVVLNVADGMVEYVQSTQNMKVKAQSNTMTIPVTVKVLRR